MYKLIFYFIIVNKILCHCPLGWHDSRFVEVLGEHLLDISIREEVKSDAGPEDCLKYSRDIWASSRENLSSGFPSTRVYKQSPQLQRLAKKLKFHL